ncbi:MAG: hydroxyacylglutathione hydrolase [Dokdonella sp.]
MTINILQAVPALSDNYIWLLADPSRRALLVDPGAAAPALEALRSESLDLAAILLTHHHYDHIDGVSDLIAAFPNAKVIGGHDPRFGDVEIRVGEGDRVDIPGTEFSFDVIEVPGHTTSHVAYIGHGLLFCGDTLFSAGCGRMFEGTPEQMLASLDRLADLPGETRVCCGHEYTLANLAFAKGIEPGNEAITAREKAVRELRAAGKPSLPSLISNERACNPFLRVDQADVIAALRLPDSSRSQRFAELRQRKDDFKVAD